MVQPEARERIAVPDGVRVIIAGRSVTVSGPRGELSRAFSGTDVEIEKDDGHVVVRAELPRRRQKALVGTYASHIRNMVAGVQREWEYHMKIVFSHFPIKARVSGEEFLVENFLGEKTPRRAPILAGVKVKVDADSVTVTGVHLENVGQTAANIEQATRIRDRDPRVFQDGIYITQKPR